jgi:hypothetical protein
VPRTFPTQGRTRQLLSILKQGATDGFKDLGNVGGSVTVPMHQAMVVLSNGASGTDVAGASPAAEMLKQYMTKGRFPEDNQSLPKAPVPIVSVWFPSVQTEELYQNARQFMENLANTEIGGFYGILREGQAAKAATIVTSVRRRFDQMHIIKWRVPCVAPTVGQSFRLEFKDTDPQIAGDASFANVPVGIDPSTWPLEIDFEQTLAEAKKEKLYPGGTVRIYGNFCWGADAKRAKLYMIPKNQPAPTTLKGKSVDEARKVQQQLIASKMVGKAISSDASYVEFEVPDNPKFLQSKGKDKYEARLVVVDTSSYRSSAITADKILTLPAMKKPLNLWLIGGLTFGGVVLLLLVIQIFRGGGGRRRGGAGAQRPMVPQPPAPGMPGGPGGYAPR